MASTFPIPDSFKKNAWINETTYNEMYERSLKNPEDFWAEQAKRIDWIKPWTKVKDTSFSGDVHVRWYLGAKLNVSVNCIDRHLPMRAKQVALIFEPDDPKASHQDITYQELADEVGHFANVLK